jgi:EmrB/QacA subfamily drug resistance transporter
MARSRASVTLVVATAASFITPFMGAATNIALPAIGRELDLDAVGLSWIATVYLLSAAVFLVPFGKAADLHGRKRVFVSGLAVHTLASLWCTGATSPLSLLAARAFQGVGGGMIFGTSVALLTSAFPPGRRGQALGVNVAAVYLGLSLGPSLGGVLTDQAGWRAVFLVNGLLGTVTVALAAWGLPREPARAARGPFDRAGSVLYGAGLAALMYGLSRLPGTVGAAFVAGGVGLLAVFVTWERRVSDPVLDVGLFLENRVFAFSNLAALVSYAATFATGFLLSLHLQYVAGLTAQGAGAILVAQPLVQAAVSPFAGRLSDRVDSRIVASAGMAVTAAGLASLALLDQPTPLAFVIASLVLLGVGFGLFSSPNTNAVMASIDAAEYGVASAVLATMRLGGQMLSMGVAGLLLTLFGGNGAPGAGHGAFLAAERTAFGLFSLLCVAGTFASLARGRTSTAARP